MQALTWHILRSRVLLLVAMLLGIGAFGIAEAATLPASTCTAVGTTRTCDLYALPGSVAMPDGTVVPIWGYSLNAAGPGQLPAQTLIANQGETLKIILHNGLGEASSLDFIGQSAVPDTIGAPAGGSTTYTLSNLQPGTTPYQAGLTPPAAGQLGGLRQAAMGLVGPLIVRPTGCTAGTMCAYSASSTFDEEALVVVSEIDPAFNSAPATFVLSGYAPKFWLINGQAYPWTDKISSTLGHRVLLRYLNAGLRDHAVGVLGMHQTVLSEDGKALAYPYQVVAQTIPAGQTMDTIAIPPPTAGLGSHLFALYNASDHLDNKGQLNTDGTIKFGGMLTFISTVDASGANPTPVTSNVQVSPNPTTGTSDVSLTSTMTSAGPPVTDAEYFIDTTGTNGNGIHFLPNTAVRISAAMTLAALANGDHPIYVHGWSSNGWGAESSVVLTLAKAGPTTSNLGLNPNPTNGTIDVQIVANADDTAAGNGNVDKAEFFIDASGAGGTGTSLTVAAPPAPVSAVSGAIPAATIAALSEGNHTVKVRAHDTWGNWGAFATLTLPVDKTGPTTSNMTVSQTPNNGNRPLNSNNFIVLFSLHIADPMAGGIQSNVHAGEGFLDTTGADGSGVVMLPSTGSHFDTSPTMDANFQMSLYSVQALSEGSHTVYAHAQDAAGNWGPYTTAILVIDKTGPNITNLQAAPSTTNGATSVNLTATATDPPIAGGLPFTVGGAGCPPSCTGSAPASNVVAAEWFEGADPGPGLGHAMTMSPTTPSTSKSLSATASVSGWTVGPHTVSVRGQDEATNWGPVGKVTVNVTSTTSTLAITSGPTSSGVTASGATIAWTTNNASNSVVKYGTTTAYGSTVTSASLVTSHSVSLTGLNSATTYHYQVGSTANGVTVTSADFTVTTTGAGPVVLVGTTGILTNADNNPAGTAEAFRYTASASGTATRLWVYLTAPSNTATSVVVGIYSNTAQNNPGTLLTSGVINRPTAGWTSGWYSVPVTAATVSSGQTYWLAILGRGGVVQFVDTPTSTGGRSQTSAQPNLTALPATWTPGATYNNAPASEYAATN